MGERYDRGMADIIQVQDDVVRCVESTLAPKATFHADKCDCLANLPRFLTDRQEFFKSIQFCGLVIGTPR